MSQPGRRRRGFVVFDRPGQQIGQGPAPRYLWPRRQVFHPWLVFVAMVLLLIE